MHLQIPLVLNFNFFHLVNLGYQLVFEVLLILGMLLIFEHLEAYVGGILCSSTIKRGILFRIDLLEFELFVPSLWSYILN